MSWSHSSRRILRQHEYSAILGMREPRRMETRRVNTYETPMQAVRGY